MSKVKKRVYILNIIVVLSIIMISFSITGMWPFGDKSIAAIDLSSQYLGFYDYLGGVFEGTEGIFYSFNKGAGGGMFALWTYYLMSPFNLVFSFFNGDSVLQGVQIVYLLKMVALTLTATHYFKRKEIEDIYNTMFTLGWVFSAYVVMYSINLMWIDALIYLPLLILALDEGLESNRFGKYILWLTLTIYSNYYIGYMVGIYTIIYVLYRYLTQEDGALKLVGYVKGCIISGVLSLWVLVPTAYSMIGGVKTNKIAETFFTYNPANLLSVLRFIDTSETGYRVGAPLLMFGTALAVYLLIVLLNTTKKQRLAYLFITLIYLVSFTVRPVSRLWTIGQDETWYLHRFAFTYVWFNITYLVHNKQYLKQELKRWQGLVLTLIWVISSIFIYNQDGAVYTIIGVVTLVLAVLHGLVIVIKFKGVQYVLVGLLAVEAIAMMVYSGTFIGTKKINEVETTRTQQEAVMEVIKQDKEPLSRVYYGRHESNYNSGFTLGESTIAHTSSTIGEGMRFLQNQLGLVETYSFIGVTGMNEIAATLLNVQYVDTTFDQVYMGFLKDSPQFESVTDTVYLNKARLGFGYTIPDIIESKGRGLNFNGITNVLTGKSYMDEVDIDITDSHNIEVEDGKYTVQNKGEEAYITYTLTGGVNYVYKDKERLTISATNKKEESQRVEYMFGNYLTSIDEGLDTYQYQIKYEEELIDNTAPLPKFYRLNKEDFLEDISQYFTKHSQFNLKEQGKGRIKGSINNTYNDPYVQLSIPYEEGWVAYVNGEQQEVQNSMNYLAVSIPEGESEIVLVYHTPLLRESLLVILILTIIYVGLDWVVKTRYTKGNVTQKLDEGK